MLSTGESFGQMAMSAPMLTPKATGNAMQGSFLTHTARRNLSRHTGPPIPQAWVNGIRKLSWHYMTKM
jgi:hypothetical protein